MSAWPRRSTSPSAANSARTPTALAAGEPSSYYGVGAQSFTGYDADRRPASIRRNNYALYADLAADVITDLYIDMAGRYEHYSDFGVAEVGKVTARYDFSPVFGIRGTFSTGFRAPTLQEEYLLRHQRLAGLRPGSVAAQLAVGAHCGGFAPLKPELSHDYSAGFVLHPPRGCRSPPMPMRSTSPIASWAAASCWVPRCSGAGQQPDHFADRAEFDRGPRQHDALRHQLCGNPAVHQWRQHPDPGRRRHGDLRLGLRRLGHVNWSAGFNYNEHQRSSSIAPLPAGDVNVAYRPDRAAVPQRHQRPDAIRHRSSRWCWAACGAWTPGP